MKFLKKQSGFTLIELLIVMMVLVTVGIITASIIVSALRGSNKTNTINTVRQNGNYAISQISKMLEFSQGFVGVSNDNVNYSTACSSPTATYKYIKIVSFDNGTTVFSCNVPSSTISSNSASLISPSDVALTSCSFTCSRNISVPPTIGIDFMLTQKSSSNFFENKDSVEFKTSVILRNLNK